MSYTGNMIEVEGISKKYNDTEVLSEVSFGAGEGETIALLGRSDAGKTTLMNIVSGCIHADKGTVKLCGKDIVKKNKEAKQCFGYVPSRSLLYRDMSVRSFLAFAGRLKGIAEKKLGDAIYFALKEVSAEYLLNARTDELSAFEDKLIVIAQAIMAKPPILLIDAPTVKLEPAETEKVRELIRRLSERHTVLLSTSLLYEAAELCSRVIILNMGRVAADRQMSEFQGRTAGREQLRLRVMGDEMAVRAAFMPLEERAGAYCYVERSGERMGFNISIESEKDIRAEVFSICAASSVTILEMRRTSISLEDIYLQLTSEGGMRL